MRILLVEDEPDLSRQLKLALGDAGYAVDYAADGEEAHFLGDTEPYDAIVLDLGLPKIDGVSVLEKWRKGNIATPVLILTARGAWSEKVAGFDAGADDYLTKPFHTEELLARLRALVHHQIVQQPVLQRGQPQRLAVDRGARGARIEPEGAADQGGGRMPGGPPQQGPEARQQLFGVEGLGQVVVGAGVEAGDLLAPGAAGGEDQHRSGHALLAPALEHRDAVDLGQAEVEHDGVVGLGLAQEMGLLAVSGVVDRIAGVRQRHLQLA